MVPHDDVRDFREVAEGRLGVLPASIADDGLVVHHLGPFKTATCGEIGRQRSSVCQQEADANERVKLKVRHNNTKLNSTHGFCQTRPWRTARYARPVGWWEEIG